MLTRPARLKLLLGLDAQVLPTLMLRGWTILAGGVMILLVPLWLGKVEQGYYYTFSSLLALQVFFELGMNQVVVQMVSHDFAHLREPGCDMDIESNVRISRLHALVGLLRRWYRVAAILLFLSVSLSGFWFFRTQGNLPTMVWGGAWLLLVAATAANLYLSAMLTVLEGCGEVGAVARMRLRQSMIGYGLMWIALACGGGLWAVPLVPLTGALYSAFWLRRNGALMDRFGRSAVDLGPEAKVSWRRDIFPFQWRIAVSWISGYFVFQLFTPLAFAKAGAVEAGRLGISLAVFSALLTVGMSWVNAKVPAMAAHVSRGERAALNALFMGVLKRSLLFTMLATLAILVLAAGLIAFDTSIAQRFARLPVLVCLAVVSIANSFIFAAAAYMRAHKEEPMMWVSLVAGVATLGAAAFGARWGIFPMMVLYVLVTLGLSLPWTLALFRRYFRRAA